MHDLLVILMFAATADPNRRCRESQAAMYRFTRSIGFAAKLE